MEYFFLPFFFVSGIVVGSFLNGIALRYNSGLSWRTGRSRCFSCNKILAWFELLPVASFIYLRGRCRGCRSRISYQYPIAELLTGVMFTGIWVRECWPWSGDLFTVHCLLSAAYYCTVFSVLMIIALYDLRHKIIPDGLVFTFAILALGRLLFLASIGELARSSLLWNVLAGPMLFLPFFLIWFFSRGAWMGFGDAKLSLGIGWLLGPFYGFSALVLAFWTGTIVSVSLVLAVRLIRYVCPGTGLFSKAKHLTMKSEIPFAPFLIFSTLVVFLFRVDVLGFAELFL